MDQAVKAASNSHVYSEQPLDEVRAVQHCKHQKNAQEQGKNLSGDRAGQSAVRIGDALNHAETEGIHAQHQAGHQYDTVSVDY